MRQYSFLVLLFLIISSCGFNKRGGPANSNSSQQEAVSNTTNLHTVTVTELVQTSNYSYVKLKEGSKEYWAAVPRFDAKVGQTYYYIQAMEMNNFKSKELNRTFESLFFLEGLSDKPGQAQNPHIMTTTGRQKINQVPDISVKPAEGGITIAKLMSDKAQFANKKIVIRGKVVKFSPEIMNINWIHLQDGTEASGEYDLVVTTKEVVKVGDVVICEGVIATDKDFGYGYKYDVIMEDAKIVKGTSSL